MRVKSNYYQDNFHSPEVCERIVEFCKQKIRESGRPYTPEALVAKRLQSIISKYYKKSANSTTRICKKWEDNPQAFIDWVLSYDTQAKMRMVRINPVGDFSELNYAAFEDQE